MKTKILLLIISLIISSTSNAQVLTMLDNYGNSDSDRSQNVALDDEGNIYITGSFHSPTLNLGGITLVNSGGGATNDVFVAKFDPTGVPLWAVSSYGPNAEETAVDIAIDDDLVYIIGSFEFDNIYFDPSTILSNSGGSDFFVASFKKSTGSYVWSFTNDEIAGNADLNEFGEGIAVTEDGELHIIGSFNSDYLDCDFYSLTNSLTGSGTYDIFMGTLNVSAISYSFNWFHNPDGTGNDFGKDIAIDLEGNVYSCGYFYSEQILFDDASPSSLLLNTDISGSTSDIFTVNFDSGSFIWGENPTGNADDYALGIATNGSELYITGGYKSANLDFGGTTSIISNPVTMFTDFYLAKYDLSVLEASWVKTADANITPAWNFDDYGKDLAIDPAGFVYVTGWYNSYKINYGSGELTNETNNNYSEVIVAKYSNTGLLHWIESGHGIYNDRGMGVDVKESDGCCIITGWYESDPMNFGTYSLTLANPVEISDFYVGRSCGYDCISECEYPTDTLNTGTGGIGNNDPSWSITVDPSGGSVPRPAVGCNWSSSSWSYGSPFAGSNWISTDVDPIAVLGMYSFEKTFEVYDSCIDPFMGFCLLADDSVDIFLNGVHIGSGGNLNIPTYFSASGWSIFTVGTNVLRVDLYNSTPNQAAFDLKGWVCCEDMATGYFDQQMENNTELTLYPNPANDHININTMVYGCIARIYSYTGKQMMEFDVNSNNISLDISKLSPGLYFVNLTKDDGSSISSSFIKN